MNLRRTWAIAHKETLHILRDPRSLIMALAIPCLLLLLFGYALTLDVDRVPLVVLDHDNSPTSRELVARFDGSRYFATRRYVNSYADIEQDIDHRLALVALVIPPDFARNLLSNRDAQVQLLVDGTDSNTASLAIGYAEALVLTYSQQFSITLAKRLYGHTIDPPLELRPRVWFNPLMQSRNDIVPGLIAVIMMIIAALLTSLTIAREWETGTMEQLIATPIRGSELITGKLLPYFALGLIDVAMAALMGRYLFHVPIRGSIALLFLLATIFLTGSLALGILFSIVAKSQLLANQLAMIVTFLPAFLLSGFMYPIRNMPDAVQLVTYLIPARYFIALLRSLYAKGVGLDVLYPDTLLLVLFGVIMAVLAHRKFRKSLV